MFSIRFSKNKIFFKLKKAFTFFLIFNLVFSWSYGLIPELENWSPKTKTVEAASAWNLRQEINILNSYLVAPASTVATSSEIIRFDPTVYSGTKTYYLEIVASTSASFSNTVTLRRSGNGTDDCTVTIPVGTNTTYTLIRSSACTLPTTAQNYVLRISSNAGGTTGVKSARLIVLQSFAGTASSAATSTQTQIEIGSATTTATNTTTLPLQYPKYWTYDSAKWDGNLTFSVDVSFKTGAQAASSTTYSIPGTYTYIGSKGVSYVVVEAWGAGGGGGSAASGGGGGGGGAYARSTTTISAGTNITLSVGSGGADETNGGDSTYGSTVVVADGGNAASNATGGSGGNGTISVGQVEIAGNTGGNADTGPDTGGGGGGAGGPSGSGSNGQGGQAAVGGSGGTANCNCTNTYQSPSNGGNGGAGSSGTSAATGGNGGGGSDTSNVGGPGGAPGGGAGGGDGNGNGGTGGNGQIILTEIHGGVNIGIEEDDGAFGSWTYKVPVVSGGVSTTTASTTRSASFTPTNGRHYRLVASSTASGVSYDIYNAKIVVNQNAGTWNALNATGATKAWTGVSVNPSNGDVYATVLGGDIYKQTGGTGDFVALNATGATKSWWGVSVNPSNGDVYAAVYLNDIYKQTGGTGDFVALNATGATKLWRSISVNPSNGDVYASVYTGDIYKQTGGTGDFVALNATGATKAWGGVSVNPSNGDVYASVNFGDIYKQTGGTGDFVALNATGATKEWWGISVNPSNGDVYASVNSGDIYKQTGGTGDFVALNATGATQAWRNIVVNSTDGDVYAVVQSGDIYYKQTEFFKLETQYLLANTKLASGTGYQSFLTKWDTTEWSGVDNTYLYAVDAADNSTSVVILNSAGSTGSAVGTVTSPDNHATSTSVTMPSSGNLDVKATTNNNDIYGSRILVQVAPAAPATAPTVETNDATSVTDTTAVLNGNITDTGGADVTVRGFATSTTSTLLTDVSTTTESGTFGTGPFTKTDSVFVCGTDYYYRAYATNSAGTSYGVISGPFTTSSCGVTVSGVAYQSEGGAVATSKSIKVYKNGTTLVGSATSDASTGAWSVTDGIISGDVITVYIDNDAIDANTVFVSDGITKSNINLYGNALVVRDDVDGIVTNANLFTGAIYGEADMIYATSSTADITLDTDAELHIYDSDTLTTGGTITTQGTGGIHIDDNATATLNTATNAIAGNAVIDIGATLSITAATTISGDVAVIGTLSGTGNLTVNEGDVTGSGLINMTAGVFTLDGVGLFGGNTAWSFNELKFGDGTGVATTTSTGTGAITSATTTISANQIMDAGVNKTWNLTASHEPFQLSGTLLASSSTFVYQAVNNATVTPATYYNLSLSPPSGSPTYKLATTSSQTITVNNDITLAGAGNVTLDFNTYDPAVDINGNLTIGGGDVMLASDDSITTIAGNFDNSGTFTHSNGAIAFDTSGTSQITSSADITFYNFVATTSGKVLQFQSHTTNVPTFTFAGAFIITGSSGLPVYIQSNSAGNQWLASFSTSQTDVTYAYIKDSACAVGSYSVAYSPYNSASGTYGTCWNISNRGSSGDGIVQSIEQGSGGGTVRTTGGAGNAGTGVEGGSGGGDSQGNGGNSSGGGGPGVGGSVEGASTVSMEYVIEVLEDLKNILIDVRTFVNQR